jgi:hypothetical protein
MSHPQSIVYTGPYSERSFPCSRQGLYVALPARQVFHLQVSRNILQKAEVRVMGYRPGNLAAYIVCKSSFNKGIIQADADHLSASIFRPKK